MKYPCNFFCNRKTVWRHTWTESTREEKEKPCQGVHGSVRAVWVVGGHARRAGGQASCGGGGVAHCDERYYGQTWHISATWAVVSRSRRDTAWREEFNRSL